MALSDPLDKAVAVRTPRQAARLMARLEHEISEDLSATEEWHDLADQAVDDLRARFPTARSLDAYQQPPASSPAAWAGIRARERPGQAPRVRSPGASPSSRRPVAHEGRHRLARAGEAVVLAGALLFLWRLLRRRVPRSHHAVAALFGVVVVAVVFGWRAGAALAFGLALLAPLQRLRAAAGLTGSGRRRTASRRSGQLRRGGAARRRRPPAPSAPKLPKLPL